MREYLLGIIGVILIILLLEIILSDGKMKSQVKTIYSMILILVILSPIVNIKNNNFELDFLTQNEITFDQSLLNYGIEKKIEYYEESVNDILVSININNAKIELEKEIVDYQINLKKIIIYLEKASINNVDEHINIAMKIKERINNSGVFKNVEVLVYE